MRRQLLRGGVAIVAVTLALFALPLAVVVRAQAVDAAVDGHAGGLEQLATLLDEGASSCEQLGEVLGDLDRAGGVRLAVFDRAGRLRLDPSGARPGAGPEVASAAGGITAGRRDGGALVAAAPLSTLVCEERIVLWGSTSAAPASAAAGRATLALAVAGGVALVLGGGAAALAGRRLARPLEALAASAERLGEGDFSERAPRARLPEPDAIADALDRTADRLGRAVERSAAFTADASHQLRTPLTALRLHLEGAAPQDAGVAAAVAGALAEADRLEATVAELVALTRTDSEPVPVDVAALVRSRAAAWHRRAAAAERTLVVDAAPVPARRVRRAALAQALEVLVDNALRHGTGTVRVEVRPATPDAPDDAVRVVVADAGPGPTPAALEPLRGRDRGPAPRRTHGGRGLPLARALVEGEHGRLVAEDREGRTVLVVLLPEGPRPGAGAPPAGGERAPG